MARIQRLQFAQGIEVGQLDFGMLTIEGLAKGTTEMNVTQRIDQRIERRIQVAEPNRCGIERLRNAVLTPGNNEKENEVGQPTDGEHADEHSQLTRGFQFFLQRTGETRIDDVIEKGQNGHLARATRPIDTGQTR